MLGEAAAIPQLPCPVTNSVCHAEYSEPERQAPAASLEVFAPLLHPAKIWGNFSFAFQSFCEEIQGFALPPQANPGAE